MSTAGGDLQNASSNPATSVVTKAAKIDDTIANLISYSVRQEPVDYNHVRNFFQLKMKEKFSNKDDKEVGMMCLAVGISLNNESLRGQQGRFFRADKWIINFTDLLDVIKTGSTADVKNPIERINASKKSLSIARIAKAFAADNIVFLSKRNNACRFEEALSPKLPLEYRFPFVIYGLTNEDLVKLYEPLKEFYNSFDKKIADAYSKGYIKDMQQGGKKRSWASDFDSYCSFRKINLAGKK